MNSPADFLEVLREMKLAETRQGGNDLTLIVPIVGGDIIFHSFTGYGAGEWYFQSHGGR